MRLPFGLKPHFRTIFYLLAMFLFLLAGSAFAKDVYTPEDSWHLSEIRIGFLKHDVDHLVDPFTSRQEHGMDVNGEFLFVSPHFLHYIGSPRPNLGATINTNGDTSHVYAALEWGYEFDCGLFTDVNGGFSVHSGILNNSPFDDNHEKDKRLGSRLLFHFAPEIGYRFASGYGVSLYWEHQSNGQVLTNTNTNEGLDNVGIRLSYKIQAEK